MTTIKHAFEAIQIESNGNEAVLDSFRVTKKRSADDAYHAADALCQKARNLPHKPHAYVREVGAEGNQPMTHVTEITPVLFRKLRGKQYADDGVTAVFPCEPHSRSGDTMSCYAHVGQHGECSYGWYYTTIAAKPDEYASLQRELESAPFNYKLQIYKRMQPWMRDALRNEAQRLRNVDTKLKAIGV